MSCATVWVRRTRGKWGNFGLGLWVVAAAAAASEGTHADSAKLHATAGLEASKQFAGLASLCDLTAPLQIGRGGASTQPPAHLPPPAPMQVFDNLYFVGTSSVSAWVIETSAGLILLDALNDDKEAETYIERGLRKLGLDPAQLKYLIITHAHGDHYGGYKYVVDRFHPRVVMSDADWKELEKPVLQFSDPRWGAPPKRDMTVGNGDDLVLGDTTVTLYVTPGHTPGTLSPIFTVKDNGVVHRAALWGGTGFNFGPDEARLRQYADSARQFAKLAQAQNVDVFLSNHPARDGALENMARLAQRQSGEPNPFVKGAAALGAFTVLRECALAQAERVASTASK